MKQIRVQIDAIDDEGRGRGSFTDSEGHEFDVAVRGAFIDDDVVMKVERTFSARSLLVGKVTHFFKRGNCHVDRKCPHSEPCPACPLHGLNRSLAAEVKRGRIEQALLDEGLDFEVEDFVPHPHEFGYRQKVKLMAHLHDEGLRLGVYIPYSHDFVVAEQCPYVQPQINQAIDILVSRLNDGASLGELQTIKAVILRASQNGVAAIIVTKQALSKSVWEIFAELVREKVIISVAERIQLVETNSILSGEKGRQLGPELIASLEGGPLVDADSFCQSDPNQATHMYDLVATYLTKDSSRGLFVDAYAGVGGFSRALLRCNAEKIVAVELSPNALVSLNQLGEHIEVLLRSMSEALSALKQKGPISGIVVDPPKKGLMQDAQGIADLNAKKLVLVSCDPDAMARDLKHLCSKGYQVDRIIPIDLFGGTPAIETIVMMRR